MIKHAIVAILVFCLLPLAVESQKRAPTSTTASGGSGNVVEIAIFGQVTMPDNASNKGLEVVLENADRIPLLSTTTDDDGRFQFRQLLDKTYYLYVDLEGYAPIEQQVSPQQSGPAATAVVVLQLTKGLFDPNRKTASPSDRAKAVDGTPGVLSVSLANKYPPKAVKEYQQGLDEEAKSNNEKALAHFEKATSESALFYEAWLEMGRTRQRLGRFDPADQAFQKARELQPQSAQPLIELGGLGLDRARKLETDGNGAEAMAVYKNSLKVLDDASKLDPNSQQAAYFRGSAQFKVGDLPGAEASLKAAIEGPRPYQDARLMLVNVFMKQRRYPDALEQLRAYLEANPNTPQRKAIEQMQAQIRALPQI